MNKGDALINEIIDIKLKYRSISIEHWLNYELFKWQWWLGLSCVIIPLIIWWKLVDRKRVITISLYGAIVNISATFLDVSGSDAALWEYPIRLLPHIPLMFPVDLIVLPISAMLLYQYFPKWKGFLVSNIILSATFSFILEPLAVFIGVYKLLEWKYIYSFPIYLIIMICSKLVSEKIASYKNQ